MAFPTITDLPSAPQRTQTPDAFATTADTFVAALPDLVTEVNTAGSYIDTKTASVGNDFQGTYSAGTTYTTGQSVLYSGAFYVSLVDSNTGNTPDSSPSQWVEIAGATGGGTPSGALMSFAGTTEPDGWLFCYGQAVSRTTYAALFTAISTTYGVGDGSTTFNLPDLRGRTVAGQDDMGGTSANRLTGQSGGVDGDTLGGTGGAETHTLSTTELASHVHSTPGAANISGSTHYTIASTTSGGKNTNSAGGGGAHNNVQPTIVLNYIIKT